MKPVTQPEAYLELALRPPEPTPAPAPRPRPMWRPLVRQALICCLIAAVSVGVFQFVSRFLFQSVQIVGNSMTPTLHDSERYVLNRLVYQMRDPEPQEIVVLRDPSDNCYAVKRIVAKQGDLVHIKDGHLYVNGQLLRENYLPADTPTYAGPRYNEQMWICGVNQYFVLGDNRNNSADSRVYGTVPRENILGMLMP